MPKSAKKKCHRNLTAIFDRVKVEQNKNKEIADLRKNQSNKENKDSNSDTRNVKPKAGVMWVCFDCGYYLKTNSAEEVLNICSGHSCNISETIRNAKLQECISVISSCLSSCQATQSLNMPLKAVSTPAPPPPPPPPILLPRVLLRQSTPKRSQNIATSTACPSYMEELTIRIA